MSVVQLSLESIDEVNGGVLARALQKALQRVAQDIESAPDVPDWRKVVLSIRAKPQLVQLKLDHVLVEFDVGHTTPKRTTSARMEVRTSASGATGLFFDDETDNVRQRGLGFDAGASEVDLLADELRRQGRTKLAATLEQLQDELAELQQRPATADPIRGGADDCVHRLEDDDDNDVQEG